MTDPHFSTAPHQLVGAREVAKVFGMRPSTVQRWGRNGTVPTIVYPNGRRMFSLDWCRWYLADHRPEEARSDKG